LGFSFKKSQLDKTLKQLEFHQTSGQMIPTEKMMTFYAIKNKSTQNLPKIHKKEVKNGKFS